MSSNISFKRSLPCSFTYYMFHLSFLDKCAKNYTDWRCDLNVGKLGIVSLKKKERKKAKEKRVIFIPRQLLTSVVKYQLLLNS